MSISRRSILGGALGITGALTLSACGGDTTANNTASSTTQAPGAAAAPVEIEFWYAWADAIGETNQAMAKQFNESQDEVKVKAVFQGSYDELHAKVRSSYRAGNAPALTLCEVGSVGAFASQGIAADLGPFLDGSDVDLDAFYSGLLTNSTIDDKLVALPYMRSMPIMYLNEEMLVEAGLDPAGPETWDDLRTYGEALKASGVQALGFPVVNEWYFEAFINQNGGSLFNEDQTAAVFNSPEGVEVIELWRGLIADGLMSIATGKNAGQVIQGQFTGKKLGAMYGSVADIATMTGLAQENGFTLRTAVLPGQKSKAVPTGGANLYIVSNVSDEQKQAAWKFLSYLMQPAQTGAVSRGTGYVPVMPSVSEDPEMKKFYEENPQFLPALEQIDSIVARPTNPNAAEAFKAVTTALTELLLDPAKDIASTLDAAAENATAILGK